MWMARSRRLIVVRSLPIEPREWYKSVSIGLIAHHLNVMQITGLRLNPTDISILMRSAGPEWDRQTVGSLAASALLEASAEGT